MLILEDSVVAAYVVALFHLSMRNVFFRFMGHFNCFRVLHNLLFSLPLKSAVMENSRHCIY